MNRYYTVMLVPEKDRPIISFRIPQLIFRSFSLIFAALIIMIVIFAYDYQQVLNQVYENKHLSLENRKLRDQLNIFHMKINTLTNDIQRIYTFEKKLRIITGLEKIEKEENLAPSPSTQTSSVSPSSTSNSPAIVTSVQSSLQTSPTANSSGNLTLENKEETEKDPHYQELQQNYRQDLSEIFHITTQYTYDKTWSDLAKRTYLLANQFALFDFQFNKLKSAIKDLEIDINQIDQYLLDKESFLRSTPTILPTKGWITSYYGPRQSPYSGRLKMHEGLDIGAQIGTDIVAPADGIITYSGHKPGFGNFVQVDHGYGLETIYGHAKILTVRNGQKVKRGEVIAKVGNTGLSTGPHLHYEVRVNGIAVDPFYFVLD